MCIGLVRVFVCIGLVRVFVCIELVRVFVCIGLVRKKKKKTFQFVANLLPFEPQ